MRDYEAVLKQARTCANRKYCDLGGNCEYYDLDVCCQGGEKDILNEAADAIEELLKENGKLENSGRVLMAAFARLKEKVPHWISVEDEPPKENGRYLVRYKRDVNLGDEETVHEDEIRIMRFFVDDGWRYPIICNDHVRLVNEEVTHWMPLPEAPEEVE